MMTTRPIDPIADNIERYERSWTFAAGSRRWSFTKVDYRSSCTALQIIDHRDTPRRSITTMVGAMLAMIAGATTLGIALHADRAAAGNGYRLSIVVPERVTPKAAKVARKPVTVATPEKAVAVAPTPTEDLVADDASVSILEDAAPETPVRLASMQPAVSAAMKTGQMQQWAKADGSERGFVVAGPSDGGCRTLSVLIKRGGDNEVKTLRECGAAGRVMPTAATAGDRAVTAGDVSIDQ